MISVEAVWQGLKLHGFILNLYHLLFLPVHVGLERRGPVHFVVWGWRSLCLCVIVKVFCFFQFMSDFNGEDRFMTRIGVGGLINLEKIKQAHVVLNDIHLFHERARGMGRRRGDRGKAGEGEDDFRWGGGGRERGRGSGGRRGRGRTTSDEGEGERDGERDGGKAGEGEDDFRWGEGGGEEGRQGRQVRGMGSEGKGGEGEGRGGGGREGGGEGGSWGPGRGRAGAGAGAGGKKTTSGNFSLIEKSLHKNRLIWSLHVRCSLLQMLWWRECVSDAVFSDSSEDEDDEDRMRGEEAAESSDSDYDLDTSQYQPIRCALRIWLKKIQFKQIFSAKIFSSKQKFPLKKKILQNNFHLKKNLFIQISIPNFF